MKQNTQKDRYKHIDITRGIGILLVIIGHNPISLFRCMIYAFHMPLFFILSGYVSHYSKSIEEFYTKTKNLIKKTIGPIIFVWAFQLLFDLIFGQNKFESTIDLLIGHFFKLLLATSSDYKFGDIRVPHITPIWFIIVLIFGRILYDFLQLKLNKTKLLIFVSALSIFGILIGQKYRMPYSLDITLAVLPFFYIGNLLKRFDLSKTNLIVISAMTYLLLLICIYLITGDYLTLTSRDYPLFPLCYVCAVGATVFIMGISYRLARIDTPIINQLAIIGEFSLYVLIIHILDFLFPALYTTENVLLQCFLRVSIVLVAFYSYMFIRSYIKRDVSVFSKGKGSI